MRDLVLASQFAKANIIFATRNLPGNINNKISSNGYKIEILESTDLDELISKIDKYAIDLLVIDHYMIDYEYEKCIKERTKVNILAFDDTYEKHYCNILLNHNVSADSAKYKGLLKKDCELRCGPKYTLIRDEFIIEKKNLKRNHTKSNNTVFVAMGGADSFNMNIQILKKLKKFKNLQVSLVTTTANKNLNSLKKYVSNNKNITLYINSTNIAKIMNDSDFAIITPSVVVNEVIYMKLPFIAIYVADNQKDIYEYLNSKGFYCLKSNNLNKLNQDIKKIRLSYNYHKNMRLINQIEGQMK